MTKKVLIIEGESGLAHLAKARLKLQGLDPKDIILSSTHEEAMEQVDKAREKGINMAIIGPISYFRGLLDEQELIDLLRMKVPGITIVSCTGRAMMGADIDIPRPDGYLKIEEVIGLSKKDRKCCLSELIK